METKKNQDLKYCRHCGSKVPSDSNYCPFCGFSQQEAIQPLRESERKGYIVKNVGRIRLTLFLISLALFIVGLTLGSQAPLSQGDAESIIQEFRNMIGSNPTTFEIALNNITICMIFFIPVVGTLFMAFVSYNTGMVLSAVTLISPSTSRLDILLTTFIFPWTWMELIAYSLASTQGIMLILGVLTGRFRQEGRRTLISALICLILLGFGAYIEAIALNYV